MPRCPAIEDGTGRRCYRNSNDYAHRDGWHEAFISDRNIRVDPIRGCLQDDMDLQREKVRWPLSDNEPEAGGN